MEQLVPKLRFPEFKEEWFEKKFRDIYSFKFTNSYSRDNLDYENGSVKNIHYGDIHTKFNSLFDIEKETVPFIKEEINITRISDDSYIKEGDLIIADASEDYNDIGKMIEIKNLNNEKVVAGLHTFLARKDTDDIQIGFSSFLMKSWNIRYQIMRIAQGTKVLSLSSKRVAELKLIIPKPKEQQKIAAFLTAIDKRLELLKKQKELLELYKKSLSQQLFSQQLRFKNDTGKDFPDWKKKSLGSVGDLINGLTYSPNDISKDGVLVLRSSNVQNRTILLNDNVYVNAKNFNPVEENDILICVRNGSKNLIGKNAIIKKKNEGLAFGAFMTVYRSKYNKFLSHWFDTSEYNKEVNKNLGATINSINGSDLKKFIVPFPDPIEQQKIATFLSAINVQIEQVSNQIEGTNEFKKGLLQKMFI